MRYHADCWAPDIEAHLASATTEAWLGSDRLNISCRLLKSGSTLTPEVPELARPCTICIHPDRQAIDRELLARRGYRSVAKQFGVGPSSTFRHRRYHIAEVMAKALDAREVRDLEHGEDMLGQLEFLNQKTLRILADAEQAGDRRGALAAIREARGTIELTAKLCGQIREQHMHLHGHQQLTPEVALQFAEAMSSLREVLPQLPPKDSILDDPHLLSGAEALPRARAFEGTDELA